MQGDDFVDVGALWAQPFVASRPATRLARRECDVDVGTSQLRAVGAML